MTLKYQVEGEDARKNINLRTGNNQHDDKIQYGHSDVSIRHDPAEI